MRPTIILSIDIVAPPEGEVKSGWNTGSGASYKRYGHLLISAVEQLPQLEFVSLLKIDTSMLGNFGSQQRILRLASRLPRLSGFRLKALDYSATFQERFKIRQEMAKTINMLPESLTQFICSFSQGIRSCLNDEDSPKPSPAGDTLTKAFYKVSLFPKLQIFYVEAMMNDTILGPLVEKKRIGILYPAMRSYTVRFLGDIYPVPRNLYVANLGIPSGSDDFPMTLAALAARQMPLLKTMTCINRHGTRGEYNRKKMRLMHNRDSGSFTLSSDDRNEWQKTCAAHHPGRDVTLLIDGFHLKRGTMDVSNLAAGLS